MEVFVARQPVFNIDEEIVGYELLYRNDLTNSFPHVDRDKATTEVIINSFLNIGLERLTDGEICYIHFTEKLLEQRLATYFSPNDIAVIISPNIELSRTLIKNCKELKEKGYKIIITEFYEDPPNFYELLPYVNIMKVDFRQKSTAQYERMEKIATEYAIRLMAEKIETIEAFEEAKKRGYELFQGYLFSEPLIESTYEIPTIISSSYHDIQNMSLEELNINELAELIERDLSFSIKLLRLINTSLVGEKHKIYSVREAVSLLGVNEIQKWIHVLAVRDPVEVQTVLPVDKQVRLSLTRAKLCETIARQMGNAKTGGYYMTGLISTLEEIVSRSMEEILGDLPLRDEIHDALMGKENKLKEVLDLVEAVEQAKWTSISEKCKQLNIKERDLFRIYAESLNWTKAMLEEENVATSEFDQLLLH